MTPNVRSYDALVSGLTTPRCIATSIPTPGGRRMIVKPATDSETPGRVCDRTVAHRRRSFHSAVPHRDTPRPAQRPPGRHQAQLNRGRSLVTPTAPTITTILSPGAVFVDTPIGRGYEPKHLRRNRADFAWLSGIPGFDQYPAGSLPSPLRRSYRALGCRLCPARAKLLAQHAPQRLARFQPREGIHPADDGDDRSTRHGARRASGAQRRLGRRRPAKPLTRSQHEDHPGTATDTEQQ